MILLNFAHPITPEQAQAVEDLLGHAVERVFACPAQFDPTGSFAEQAGALIDSVGLTAEEWQTAPLLVNLPSLSVIAGLVLAEIHGRAGYFPAVLRLRPVVGAVPPRFEVAEIVNLQEVRDTARQLRLPRA